MNKHKDPYFYEIYRGTGASTQVWDYLQERWTHLGDTWACRRARREQFEKAMERLTREWEERNEPESLRPSREKFLPDR